MFGANLFASSTPSLDVTGITNTVTTGAIYDLIEAVFPIIATAILVGIVFYVVRWSVNLFRGI